VCVTGAQRLDQPVAHHAVPDHNDLAVFAVCAPVNDWSHDHEVRNPMFPQCRFM
jgi:hypothetical protein